MKKTLLFMFRLFCAITAFETMFIGWAGLVDSEFTLQAAELFKIPFIAFMSVLPVFVTVTKGEPSKLELRIRGSIHLILTAAIVATLLIYFGWLHTKNAIIIAVFFFAIYIPAKIIFERHDKKLADKMNERINAFHKAENATHRDEP
jgi:hypothetical protein